MVVQVVRALSIGMGLAVVLAAVRFAVIAPHYRLGLIAALAGYRAVALLAQVQALVDGDRLGVRLLMLPILDVVALSALLYATAVDRTRRRSRPVRPGD